jgi:5-(carboxyamino)imidazole ribonucleotide synthase
VPLTLPPAGTAATVGVVGAGQLARMMHQAAIDLGVELVVLAERPDDPAVRAGCRALIGRPDDPEALDRLAEVSGIVTLDHELVPAAHLEALAAAGHRVRPSAAALVHAQDKWAAWERFEAAGLPVPRSLLLPPGADPEPAADRLGLPLVLKLRTGGYDGRGVEVAADIEAARRVLAAWAGREVVAQEWVDMEFELAVVGARRPAGEAVFYPLVLTTQIDGMCRELVTPAPVADPVGRRALEVAGAVAEAVGAVGAVTTELFATRSGAVLVNEIALRPHNSGHATIEAATASQFHNHLRAVLDWPLGSTDLIVPAAAMVNVVGDAAGSDPAGRLPRALEVAGASVHLYGKAPAPGRKLGHVTATGPDVASALATARAAAAALNADPASSG